MRRPAPVSEMAEAVRCAAEALTAAELGTDALELARRALGASGALVFRYDEGGALEAPGGNLRHAIPGYARELFYEDLIQQVAFELRHIPEPVVATRLPQVDLLAHKRTAAYADFYRPYDMEHVLCAHLTDAAYGTPGMTGILLTRGRSQPDFTSSDLSLLDLALPSFRAAVRRGARVEAAERERASLAAALRAARARPCFATDAEGRVLWASPEAESAAADWLRGRGQLPAELAGAIRALAAVAGGRAADLPPRVELPLELPSGRRVRADLSVERSSTGAPVIGVALDGAGEPAVLGREDAPEALQEIARAHGLTRAETAVFEGLAEGLGNRDIARRLFVSVETVRTHVHRVLGKLGVASRVQAALVARGGAVARPGSSALP